MKCHQTQMITLNKQAEGSLLGRDHLKPDGLTNDD